MSLPFDSWQLICCCKHNGFSTIWLSGGHADIRYHIYSTMVSQKITFQLESEKEAPFKYHTQLCYKVSSRSLATHGCKKCSNNHARSTDTAHSGSPRWGRQTCAWPKVPELFGALWWPTPPLMSPKLELSSLLRPSIPRTLFVWWSWLDILFLRDLKCFNMAFRAMEAYGVALLKPDTDSNDVITACTCW